MPPATIKAFKDHGKAEITLTKDVQGAGDLMDQLAEASINMTEVTQKLEDDGVAAFFKSFDSLLKSDRSAAAGGDSQRPHVAVAHARTAQAIRGGSRSR